MVSDGCLRKLHATNGRGRRNRRRRQNREVQVLEAAGAVARRLRAVLVRDRPAMCLRVGTVLETELLREPREVDPTRGRIDERGEVDVGRVRAVPVRRAVRREVHERLHDGGPGEQGDRNGSGDAM